MMMGFVGVAVAVLAGFAVITASFIGLPDHEIPFYSDTAIRFFWDNVDGDVWCIDAQTGVLRCAWEDNSGWLGTPGPGDIQAHCWPSEPEAGGDN